MNQSASPAADADGLRPIPPERRVFGAVSYVLMWWSSLIVIQAFALGQSFLPPIGKLNLQQTLVVVVVAAVIFVVGFSLNGQAGLKYGIPYSIQARTPFGLRGAVIVEILRAVPALIWYGVGTWIAALSLDGILRALTGFGPSPAKYLYFLALQGAQTLLAWRGINAMKWFNSIGSIVIAAVMIYMLVHILAIHGFALQESWRSEGNWGTPFWVSLAAAIGVLATVMLNISDMTRHLSPSQATNWLGHLFGVLPPWFFMLLLGIAAGTALGVWDPVEALTRLSPNPLTMFVLLAFVLLAQVTTNLTINILPPALIFMNTFKMSWATAVTLTGVLGALSFPWLIMANNDAFTGFILHYSALFGPVLGVMLADYFVVRRRVLVIDQLYLEGPTSPFWYHGGFNIAGIVAIAIPGIITMLWFLPTSWLIGVPSGFLLYIVLFPLMAGGRQQ